MNYDRDTSAGYLTNWAGRLFVRALERRLNGGTSGPMPVFFELQDGSALTQSELARRAAVEQPTMANTLSRMERDGLVIRTADPSDKRSSLVSLTPLGRDKADKAFAAAVEVNAVATAALTPAERPLFYDMMHRIVAALDRDAG